MIRHIVGLPYNLTLCASSAATATAAAAGYLQQLLPALQLQQPLQPVHTAAAEPYDDDPQLSRQPSPARQPEAALNSSARQMPPPTAYAVKIIIKAHELKFVKLAATVIQDLVLVNFAPKSRGVLPPGWHHANTGLSWVNLVSVCALSTFGMRQVSIDQHSLLLHQHSHLVIPDGGEPGSDTVSWSSK